jgi:hypothetical protein
MVNRIGQTGYSSRRNKFAKVSHPVALILTDVLARDVALVAAVHQPLLSVPVNKRGKDKECSQHSVVWPRKECTQHKK